MVVWVEDWLAQHFRILSVFGTSTELSAELPLTIISDRLEGQSTLPFNFYRPILRLPSRPPTLAAGCKPTVVYALANLWSLDV
jgi:hypothetical protein